VSSDLERPCLDRASERDLRERLRGGPWCWPPENATDLCSRARAVSGTDVPAVPPGCTPLVAVERGGSAASLWVLRLGHSSFASDAALEGDGVDAWTDAATVLPRCLPILWRPVQDAHNAGREIRHLCTIHFTPEVWPPARVLRGRSFGLSFILAMASRIVAQALPEGIVASAAVDADGRLAAVEGLAEKIAAIEECAPRLRQFLVSSAQVDEAKHCANRLEIVPVATAAEAVEIVLGKALRDFITRCGDDADFRAELVDSFFRLAILGRGAAIDWTPIECGARAALASWQDLSRVERWKLDIAEAVAARHEDNRGYFPLPEADVLSALSPPLRSILVAHLVQQSADTGEPAAEVARRYADPELVPMGACFTPQLKVWGATARLDAVSGRPEEALALQEQLACALFARLEYEEISYQLSEWYRLAGALGDSAAFGRATDMHRRVERLGGLGLAGSAYVDLFRASAQVCLGAADSDGPESTLRALACDAKVAPQVRWSATRWLVRWLVDSGREAESATVLEPLATSAASEVAPRRVARSRYALVRLDDAVRRSSHEDANGALEAIHELDPGPVGQLMRAADVSRRSPPQYVSVYYPY
jgi:hypothetical protein